MGTESTGAGRSSGPSPSVADAVFLRPGEIRTGAARHADPLGPARRGDRQHSGWQGPPQAGGGSDVGRLINLVGNSVKFTPKGSVRIFAGVEREHGDELLLSFRVEDTGIGIPRDKLALI